MRDNTTQKKRRPVRVYRSAFRMERRSSSSLFWWLLALALLAGFGVLAARTDGVRQLIVDRLQRRTGLTATVSSSRIGWPYDLVLENVTLSGKPKSSGSADAERLVLRLEELRLGRRLRRGMTVMVRGADVTLYTDDDGRTFPSPWAVLTDIEDTRALAAWVTRLFGDASRVEFKQVGIEWHDAEKRILTATRNLGLLSVPLRVPNRAWRYFSMSADYVQRAEGHVLAGLQQEWLVASDSSLIQLGYCVAGEYPVPEELEQNAEIDP